MPIPLPIFCIPALVSFGVFLQTRYVTSLSKDVDVNGKHFDPSTLKELPIHLPGETCTFYGQNQYQRPFSANMLRSIADFNGDPHNEVLKTLTSNTRSTNTLM